MNSTPGPFVEIDRRFRELDPNAKSEETALSSYSLDPFQRPGLNWGDLLAKKRVIVLGESGSGKTRELQERAALLTQNGQAAFFIRLDQLARQPLGAVLGSDEYQRFLRWKKSDRTAAFFLDSVDEAKFLRVSDFYAALDNFHSGIGSGYLRRIQTFLSSRISEWRPSADTFEFRRRFPTPDANPAGKEGQNEGIMIVQIEPLDREQVKRFAQANGLLEVDGFIRALDEAHAWAFAQRPLDVCELVSYWNEKRRLGSLTEIIEHDVRSKLREREGRDERAVPEAKAREGAEWLAAANSLARTFSFWVADDTPTGKEALDFCGCLPAGWPPEWCRALSNRPLFDGASYGRIRFHHRRVAEYLAAKWIGARMENGCPTFELERLLARKVGGRKLLRPSLRPIAAWLCCGNERWNQSVRALVLEAGPEIHLSYGDPAGLAVDYKRQILHAMAQAARERQRVWLATSHDSLARLADTALSPDISALMQDRTLAVDFRVEMLEIARHGRLAGCLDAAVNILTSPDDGEELKMYAVAAVGALDDAGSRMRLLEIARRWPKIPNRLCAKIAHVFYPKFIGARELAELLGKSSPVREFSTDLPFQLKSHLKHVLTPDLAGDLLKHLLILAWTPPLATPGQNLATTSDQFWWVGTIIPTVLESLLKKPSLSPDEIELASAAALFVGHFRGFHELHADNLGELNALTSRHPQVRRSYFWRDVAEFRRQKRTEPTRLYQLFGHLEVLRIMPQDFEWLVEDTANLGDPLDRILALTAAIEAWDAAGRKFSWRRRLGRAIGQDDSLREVFRRSALTSFWFLVKRLWAQKRGFNVGNRWWWKRQFVELVRRWHLLRGQLSILWNLRRLSSGIATSLLGELVMDADRGNSGRFAPSDWSALGMQRAWYVHRAMKRGCKAAWRRFVPPLPHEDPAPTMVDYRLVVGLAGLQAAVEDEDVNFQLLGEEDATLATRYAVNEMNGFASWLTDLAVAQPNAVAQVLCECIRGEWRFAKEHDRFHGVLARLIWHGEAFLPLVRGKLLRLLEAGDPPNYAILQFALTILMRNAAAPPADLRQLAQKRVVSAGDLDSKILWLAVLIQIDAVIGLPTLEQQLSGSPNADEMVIFLCAVLAGRRGAVGPLTPRPDYLRPAVLRQLIPVVYRHVKFSADIDRRGRGAYTPTPRDDAQDFRDVLLDALAKSEASDATDALRELAAEPVLLPLRDWIANLINQRLEREAESPPWTPDDLREFAEHHEVDPKNDQELFSIAVKRLLELKLDVERSDNSLRDELRQGDLESHLRRWLARKLNERSRKRYTVPQEEEIDQQEKPDLRLENPKTDPVSIEVKWADNWTVTELLERLENQLVGQYLRAHNSRYGIYLLGANGKKHHWEEPGTGKPLTFGEVVSLIGARAISIRETNPRVHGLEVVAIDFRRPAHQAAQS